MITSETIYYKKVGAASFPCISFKIWEKEEKLIHAFTTKEGGVSKGPFATLNLGLNTQDEKANIVKNYERLAKGLGLQIEDFVLSNQTHETVIQRVGKTDRGNGILYNHQWESVDGLYTSEKGVALVTHYADCVPLFFYARKYDMIGLAHAGWRGTVKGIAQKMIDEWVKIGIPLESIEVAIGPSIGGCCFEVGKEVADIFTERFGETSFITCHNASNKYKINLWECNQFLLEERGILSQNIYLSEICTCCHADLFFSHRKTKGKRGTLAAVMCLV